MKQLSCLKLTAFHTWHHNHAEFTVNVCHLNESLLLTGVQINDRIGHGDSGETIWHFSKIETAFGTYLGNILIPKSPRDLIT